jgi:Uma2 family endonuclease
MSSVSTKSPATIEDLYRERGKAELVDGEIQVMSPTGGLPGYAATVIVAHLHAYARARRSGYAIGDNVAFVVNLPRRKSFSPDAAYFVGKLTMRFLQGAPIFAVEVRSERDYGPRAERALAAKRADYFAAGTQVVWDIDLLAATVAVHRASNPQQITLYRRGEIAEAEPALPGWSLAVDELFPQDI